jgi:tRNA-dihydrouridine synthase B
LSTPQSVVEVFRRYRVDGVMIGRAALGRPWLFRRVQAALAGQPIPPDPTLAEQRHLLLEHYRLIVEQFGPEKGTLLMRRYACCYAQGLPGARTFRRRVSQASRRDELIAAIVDDFPRGW